MGSMALMPVQLDCFEIFEISSLGQNKLNRLFPSALSNSLILDIKAGFFFGSDWLELTQKKSALRRRHSES